MHLRDYQKDAHDAAWQWIKAHLEPCVIEAPTGCGKSHIIAALAKTFNDYTGQHALCTAPSSELVTQNREKYLMTGKCASIYSASAGQKCLRYPVVFGTPLTIKNDIKKFRNKIGLVIIDECHNITPTIMSIIDTLRKQNPRLRVVGLSATPYRLNTGYISRMDEHGRAMGDNETKEPYFAKKVYTITAYELIAAGYITPPVIGEINSEHYDTKHMQLNKMGKFYQADIDRAYEGQGRKTSRIIADIIRQSRDRRGVMIFAATRQHARECMESLPPGLSVLITGDMGRKDRQKKIKAIKAQKYKYIVSVGTLTTGFDAPHIDVIALLRATESVGLMQQMLGRGGRLYPGKDDFLVLDYAENIDRHCPDGDVFNPDIKVKFTGCGGESVPVICPLCENENQFTPRKNEDGFEISKTGFFTDLDGNHIETEYGPMPSHYGRRCLALVPGKGEKLEQCSYRWTSKPCPSCEEPNDIAARYCYKCKSEIIDPNEKLISDFREKKKDPTKIQCDKVSEWVQSTRMSRAGNECLVIDYYTEYRKVTAWYITDSDKPFIKKKYNNFLASTNNGKTCPETITYRKNAKTGFYDILSYNQEADKEPNSNDPKVQRDEFIRTIESSASQVPAAFDWVSKNLA